MRLRRAVLSVHVAAGTLRGGKPEGGGHTVARSTGRLAWTAPDVERQEVAYAVTMARQTISNVVYPAATLAGTLLVVREVAPPACTLTLSDGGRTLTSSCPIFMSQLGPLTRKDCDMDQDGVYQAFEEKAIALLNPAFVLDEEEEWLKPKFRHTHHAVNFCRVTAWPSSAAARYLLVCYAVTWSKDYGRFANENPEWVTAAASQTWPAPVRGAIRAALNQAIRDKLQFATQEHSGDVERVILAWEVMNPQGTTLKLRHVFTSAHGSDTGHSGVWKATGTTRVKGTKKNLHARVVVRASLKDPFDIDVGWAANSNDWMEGSLEFTAAGQVRLYPAEDKHAIYPTAAVGDAVTLVAIDGFPDVGEDCGGGGSFRFPSDNAGEPSKHLIEDLDSPRSWLGLTAEQRAALTRKFPGEQVWSGNKAILRLTASRAEPERKFCGGLGTHNWEASPARIGSKLGDPPAALKAVLK